VGNKTGWIIAGVLVLGVLGIIVKAIVFPSPTSPTSVTLKSDFMDEVTVAVPITTVIGALPAEPGNAGVNYRAAFDAFKANRDPIVNFLETEDIITKLAKGQEPPPVTVLSTLEEVRKHVLAGTAKRLEDFKYTMTCTDKKDFEVGYWYQGTFDLGNVVQCLHALVLYQYGQKQYAEAAKTETAMLVMGWHMANERARVHMTLTGLEIQIEALGGLTTVNRKWGEEHAAKNKAIDDYQSAVEVALVSLKERLPVFQAVSIEPGDILNVAENHKDRAIRVQGILFLGRLRHEVPGNRGDMRATRRLIDHYISDGDEYEAAAAKAAKDMTKEQWENLSTRLGRMEQ